MLDLGYLFPHIDRHPLDGVHQFTHVAGPRVFRHYAHRFGRDALQRASAVVCDAPQEVVDEDGDIGAALSKRRNDEVDHVDAIVKVFSELTFANHVAKVAVRRRDHADVGGYRPGSSRTIKV